MRRIYYIYSSNFLSFLTVLGLFSGGFLAVNFWVPGVLVDSEFVGSLESR